MLLKNLAVIIIVKNDTIWKDVNIQEFVTVLTKYLSTIMAKKSNRTCVNVTYSRIKESLSRYYKREFSIIKETWVVIWGETAKTI